MTNASHPPLDGYAYCSPDAVNHKGNLPGGSLDFVSRDHIRGWCLNPLAPNELVTLELRVGTLVLAEFSTGQPREDMARCFGVDTPCGFFLPLQNIPAANASYFLGRWKRLDGVAREEAADLHVTIRGTSFELPRWNAAGSDFLTSNLIALLRSITSSEAIGWFDAEWYRTDNPDVDRFGFDPFEHYRDFGWKEGRPPNRTIAAQLGRVGIKPYGAPDGPHARTVHIIAESGLFDTAWYGERYHVAENEAIQHYVSTGAFQGCDPSPIFSSLGYLKQNKDSLEEGYNPLAHLILKGFREKRKGADPIADLQMTTRVWLKGL